MVGSDLLEVSVAPSPTWLFWKMRGLIILVHPVTCLQFARNLCYRQRVAIDGFKRKHSISRFELWRDGFGGCEKNRLGSSELEVGYYLGDVYRSQMQAFRSKDRTKAIAMVMEFETC